MTCPGPVFVASKTRKKPASSAVVDIVFIHGLRGTREETWKDDASGSYWPKWLADEFPQANVYIDGYDSQILSGSTTGDGASLLDRASTLLDSLLSRPKGTRPTIFICHSLGGLITKQMLRKCFDAADSNRKALLEATKAIVFIGTPHQGSKLAESITAIFKAILSKNVVQLSYGNENVLDLHSWFRNWAAASKCSLLSYYETLKTKGVMVVDKATADPNVFGCDPTAIDGDHFAICKPTSKDAALVQSVSKLVRDIIKSVTTSTEPVVTEGASDFMSDYEYYTSEAEKDRRSLSEKLEDSGRSYLITDANRQKERFSMLLQRNVAQPSAIRRYTQLMADIDSRFNRHTMLAVSQDKPIAEVEQITQSQVIDPSYQLHAKTDENATISVVEGAMYFLAGNCHLRWNK